MSAARSQKNTIVESEEADGGKVLASRRLAEIITAIGVELGAQHGWKTHAAELLGLSRAHVSRILAGHPIGTPTVTRAADMLKLDRSYFSESDDAAAKRMLDAARPITPWLTELATMSRNSNTLGRTIESVRAAGGSEEEVSEGVRNLLVTMFAAERDERTRKLARQIMSAAGADDDATIRRLALELAAVVLG